MAGYETIPSRFDRLHPRMLGRARRLDTAAASTAAQTGGPGGAAAGTATETALRRSIRLSGAPRSPGLFAGRDRRKTRKELFACRRRRAIGARPHGDGRSRLRDV